MGLIVEKNTWEIGLIYLAIVLFVLFRPTIKVDKRKAISYGESEIVDIKKDLKGGNFAGIDVSHFQGDVNWEKVKEDGTKFVFIKATDGLDFIDPMLKINLKGVETVELPFTTYHFYEPKDDPIEQAKHYLSTIKKSGQKLRPVLDVEITAEMKPDKLRRGVKRWLKYVEKALGCRPIFYTYTEFWNKYLKEEFTEYPLWLADYSKKITLPKGVKSWSIWQHSQRGEVDGIDGYVDLNLLNGGQEKLKQLYCKG